MEWNDTGIVLQVGRFREADIWLKLLLRKRGLVTVFAFGGSRSRHRFCGCLDVLNTISCRVKSSKNGQFLNLEEGFLIRGPQLLRTDWARLGMLTNCIRFLETMNISQDGAPNAYDLMQEMLTFFEESDAPHTLYPVLFRLRMVCEQGFSPAWHVCADCGTSLEHKDIVFRMDEGTSLCQSCSGWQSSAYTIKIPSNALHALHRVELNLPTAWNVESLNFQERQACFRAIDGFVQYHLGIAWDEGRFRRV